MFALTLMTLLVISVVLLIAEGIAFYLTKAIFQREEILTKWR